MTFFGFILTLGCSLVIGLIAYYMGYMTGTEREHIPASKSHVCISQRVPEQREKTKGTGEQ